MVTGPTWRCSDCDTYNDAGVRACAVCETPRSAAVSRDAPEPLLPKKGEPKKTAATKKTAAKKTAATRKPAPKKTAAAKRAVAKTTATPKKTVTAKKAPVTKAPATSGRKPPLGTGIGVTGAGRLPTVPGLEWKCPVCARRVVGDVWCDSCGTLWTHAATTTLDKDPLFGSTPSPSSTLAGELGLRDPLTGRPTPREPTDGEMLTGCGCVLLLVAAVVTGVVLLILNWSSVTSFLTGSDSSKSSSKPSPTPSASGPCPKQMAAMLPEGSGATLVAAYSREELEERYAFCRTKTGKIFYFSKLKDGEPYDSPTEAKKSGNGYLVDFLPQKTSYRFRNGEIAAYDEDGKETWKEKLTPEASAD